MKINLDYGKQKLGIDIPEDNLLYVLETSPVQPINNPKEKIVDSLYNPIENPPLKDLIDGTESICVVISDITRAVPTQLILEVLFDELAGYGIAKDQITILIATGLHRPNEGKELEQLVGEKIKEDYRIINHDARNRDACKNIGKTKKGTPVILNKTYLESDFRILTGLIEPHFMAGFSGGRKSICPGISYLDMFKHFHGPSILESPNAATAVLEDNPFHEESKEIAKMAGVDFIINVTINKDKKVTGIFSGDLEKAHLKGAEFCLESSSCEIEKEADIVITTGGGQPLDATLYQGVKGMVGCLPAVKKDGMIIVASECQEEIGGPEFKKLLISEDNLDKFMDKICNTDFFEIDQWQLEELVKARKKAEIYFYSSCIINCPENIPEGTIKLVKSLEEAINIGLRKHGKAAKITVIPEGPYVIPILKK